MIDKLIIFSVRNPVVIGFLVLAMAVWGGYSLRSLPIDAVPDVTNNQVDVITYTPNLASLEMEMFVTSPIEMVMSNIPGLVQTRSISKFGLSVVKLVFTDDTDIYWARQQVFERLEQVKSEIPEAAGKPFMGPASTGLGEVYQYVIRPRDLSDKSFSPMELRTLQDWFIRKQEDDQFYVFATDQQKGPNGRIRIRKYKVTLGDRNETTTEVIFPNGDPGSLLVAQTNVAVLETQRRQASGQSTE
jgi:heavy metal efflux system protein